MRIISLLDQPDRH